MNLYTAYDFQNILLGLQWYCMICENMDFKNHFQNHQCDKNGSVRFINNDVILAPPCKSCVYSEVLNASDNVICLSSYLFPGVFV